MIRPTARCEADWLVLDAPLPEERHRSNLAGREIGEAAATLLTLNALLPLGWKYAMVGHADLRIRAERPTPTEADEMAAQLAKLESDYASIVESLADTPDGSPPEAPPSSITASPETANLCHEAGWPFEERDDGGLIVDLGVPGAFVPALIEVRASRISIEAIIATVPPERIAEERYFALASLMLRVNGAFRMVRAVSRDTQNGGEIPGERRVLLEAPLPLDAGSAEFDRALGAVAVAARHCAAEAESLLADALLARAYLRRDHQQTRLKPTPEFDASTAAWA